MPSSKEEFTRLTQEQHMLTRPEMYIGSVVNAEDTMCVLNATSTKLVPRKDTYNDGLYKLVDEILVNAWDQRVRVNEDNVAIAKTNAALAKKAKKKKAGAAQPQPLRRCVTRIDVAVDRETGIVTVRNDGDGINIVQTKYDDPQGNKLWSVQLVFEPRTSTNFNDDKRITGGLNGIGGSATALFSTMFKVTTVDANRQLKYTQTFEHNRKTVHPPMITQYSDAPYTEIQFKPDFARFGMTGWSEPMFKLIQKRVYDISACGNKELMVTFNSEVVPVNDFCTYMRMSFASNDVDDCFSEIINPRWEVGVAVSDNGYKQQSFVNGVWTMKGGKHTDYIAHQIANHVMGVIEKKEKVKVRIKDVTHHLTLFVRATIENPSFGSQTKNTLSTPVSKFGSTCELSAAFLAKVEALGLVGIVLRFYQNRAREKSNKDERSKRGRVQAHKLDDANFAGKKNHAHKCTLILTEGDSAKAMAMAGLSVVGRDYYGVFPLRGKMINTREKMTTVKGTDQVNANAEIVNLKKILGLEQGKRYTTQDDINKNLRYGKVMIMTDQDVDGSHIKGLFMNWIDSQWSDLIALGFVTAMITPIIKAKKGKKERPFYSIGQYTQWRETTEGKETGWTTKYYKGLGTSTANEAKEYFRALKQVNYYPDDNDSVNVATADAMVNTDVSSTEANDASPNAPPTSTIQVKTIAPLEMAFGKEHADKRKGFMVNYDIEDTLDSSLERVSVRDFVHKELNHFAVYDTQRSVPHVMDGLKPSQRKILYAAFKRNLVKEIKVAQLAGYVSEHSGYHHGEQSLNMAIIGMAQDFVGSNNLHLLMPNGQFGTRLQGGKDAASPRYIFTCLNPLTNLLFHPDDRSPHLLKYLDDDGFPIEPVHYVPVLPVGLLNGAQGIGTGYSTSVPAFNPLDVCDAFVGRLKGVLKAQQKAQVAHGGATAMDVASAGAPTLSPFPTLHPWYSGFTGTMVQLTDKTYLVKGKYRIPQPHKVVVFELPVGTWTEDYKSFLDTCLVDYTPPKKKARSGATKTASAKRKRTFPGFLKNYTSHCTESTVTFELDIKPDVFQKWNKTKSDDPNVDMFEKNLRLTSKVSLTNMHFFDETNSIHKYNSATDILETFYTVRLHYYGKRKAHKLGVLQHELDILTYKVKFIEAVIADEIAVAKQSKRELEDTLQTLQYPTFITSESQKTANYNYLLQMPIYTLTTDTLAALRKQAADKQLAHTTLSDTTLEALWHTDLTAFRTEYVKAVKKADAEVAKQAKATAKAQKKKKQKGN